MFDIGVAMSFICPRKHVLVFLLSKQIDPNSTESKIYGMFMKMKWNCKKIFAAHYFSNIEYFFKLNFCFSWAESTKSK